MGCVKGGGRDPIALGDQIVGKLVKQRDPAIFAALPTIWS
jgi:hypothetical protein